MVFGHYHPVELYHLTGFEKHFSCFEQIIYQCCFVFDRLSLSFFIQGSSATHKFFCLIYILYFCSVLNKSILIVVYVLDSSEEYPK